MRPRNRYQIHSGQWGDQPTRPENARGFCIVGLVTSGLLMLTLFVHSNVRKRLGLMSLGLGNLGKSSDEEATPPRGGVSVEQAHTG